MEQNRAPFSEREQFRNLRVCLCVNACPICLLEVDGLRWKMICEEGRGSNPLHSPHRLPRCGWKTNEQLSPTIQQGRGTY